MTRLVGVEQDPDLSVLLDRPPQESDSPFPFLRLPTEIRFKIYQMLFRCSVPVYPSTRHKDGSYVARTTFSTNILATNKQVNEEANSILWGDNQIVLQFPQDFQHEATKPYWQTYGDRQIWRPGGPGFSSERVYPTQLPSKGVTFIPAPKNLQHIKDLVIEVFLFREPRRQTPASIPAFPAALVRKQLISLCDAMNAGNGHQLQNLEIRFTNIKPRENPNHVLMNWGPWAHGEKWDECCFTYRTGFNLRLFGVVINPPTNGEKTLQELCKKSVDVDQQVLQPLNRLRGVRQVKVVGRVTDEWASYLKGRIEGEKGAAEVEFKHSTDVKWKDEPLNPLQKVRKKISQKGRRKNM
jgi:hypothetical protein